MTSMTTANATMVKFGYPANLVREYAHWVVLLRPAQPTLGSLVLAAKSDVAAFGALPPAAFTELATVIADVEAGLRAAVDNQKINYLMLMMVDPHVHCHAIPRYEGERTAGGVTIADAAWGQPPALANGYLLDEAERDAVLAVVKAAWPA